MYLKIHMPCYKVKLENTQKYLSGFFKLKCLCWRTKSLSTSDMYAFSITERLKMFHNSNFESHVFFFLENEFVFYFRFTLPAISSIRVTWLWCFSQEQVIQNPNILKCWICFHLPLFITIFLTKSELFK